MVKVDGLCQEIHRTVLHGLYGVFYRAMSCENYDRYGWICGVYLLEKLAA